MKKVIFLLVLLVACQMAQEPAVPVEEVVEAPIVEEVVQEPVVAVEEPIVQEPPMLPSPVAEQPKVPVGRQLLDEAKTKFKYHAYQTDDRLVIRVGDKVRHYFFRLSQLKNKTPITDVYVDLTNKSALAYCNIEREGKMEENSFEYERSRCKPHIDVAMEVPFDEWKPQGPLEYLEQYADIEPSLIENNTQTISIGGNSKTIQPSLHYTKDGKTVILRIDRRYKLPLRIEETGKQAVDFRDAFYDVMVVEDSPIKIDESWVTYVPVSQYWKQQEK